MEREDKGKFKGSCNFTSCQKPNSATWKNQANNLYYCEPCAKRANADPYVASDAERFFGKGETMYVNAMLSKRERETDNY